MVIEQGFKGYVKWIYIINGNFMIWVLSLWWGMTILLTTDMGTEPAMTLLLFFNEQKNTCLSILAMEQTKLGEPIEWNASNESTQFVLVEPY